MLISCSPNYSCDCYHWCKTRTSVFQHPTYRRILTLCFEIDLFVYLFEWCLMPYNIISWMPYDMSWMQHQSGLFSEETRQRLCWEEACEFHQLAGALQEFSHSYSVFAAWVDVSLFKNMQTRHWRWPKQQFFLYVHQSVTKKFVNWREVWRCLREIIWQCANRFKNWGWELAKYFYL